MAATPSSRQNNLAALFKRWKQDAGAVVDPIKEKVLSTTMQVLGIWEARSPLIEKEETAYQDLADRLTWITERLLERATSENMPSSTTEALEELRNAVDHVEHFLKDRKSRVAGLARLDHDTDAIDDLEKKLDSLMMKFAVSHTIDVAEQLQALRLRPVETTAKELPSILPSLNIPPKPVVFYGREELIETLVQALLASPACHMPILGPGGIGKTTVAAAILNDKRIREKYDNRRLFLSCEGLTSADGIAQALATALAIPYDATAPQTICASLSSMVPLVLVLDNLETAWDSADKHGVEQILGRLGQLDDVSLIITMRGSVRPRGVDWTRSLLDPLPTLSLRPAREIWTHSAGPADDKLDELLLQLDGLPLAIELMARQGQLLRPAELLEAYEREKTTLLSVDDGNKLTSLEISIQLSLGSRTMAQAPNAMELLKLLCLLPDGIPIAKLNDTLPSLNSPTTAVLALLNVGLALREKNRIRMLSPIREFVLKHHPPSGTPFEELKNHFAQFASQVQLIPKDRSKSIVAVIAEECSNLTSVLSYSWSVGAEDDANTTLESTLHLAHFSYLTGYGDPLKLLWLAKAKLKKFNNVKGEAQCSAHIGDALQLRSRHGEAIPLYEEAKTLFVSISEYSSAAMCLTNMGESLRMQGKYDAAIKYLRQAHSMFLRNSCSSQGLLRCTVGIGAVLHTQERYREAIMTYGVALSLYQRVDDRLGEAQCRLMMAAVFVAQGLHHRAIPTLQEAMPVFDSVEDRLSTAQCKSLLGEALYHRNRLNEALATLLEAETTYDDLNLRPAGMASCKQCLGHVLRLLYRYDEALLKFQQARDLSRAIDDKLAIAKSTERIGDVLHLLGRNDAALEVLSNAKDMFNALHNVAGTAECLRGMGEVYLIERDLGRALVRLEDARVMFESVGLELGVAKCLQSIGDVFRRDNDYSTSIYTLEQAKVMFQNLEERSATAQCMQSIGGALHNQGLLPEAAAQLEDARALFEEMNDPLGTIQCTRSIGHVLYSWGRFTEASRELRSAEEGFTSLGNRLGAAQSNLLLGCSLLQEGQPEEAQTRVRQAKRFYEEIGKSAEVQTCQEVLDACLDPQQLRWLEPRPM